MIVVTESGTTYEVVGNRVRRALTGNAQTMRRDEEWLSFVWTDAGGPVVGEPMRMVLQPLSSEATVTLRLTSPVVSIQPPDEELVDPTTNTRTLSGPERETV